MTGNSLGKSNLTPQHGQHRRRPSRGSWLEVSWLFDGGLLNSSGPDFFTKVSCLCGNNHYIIQFYPTFGIIMNVHQSKLEILGDQLILTKANSDCLLNRLVSKSVQFCIHMGWRSRLTHAHTPSQYLWVITGYHVIFVRWIPSLLLKSLNHLRPGNKSSVFWQALLCSASALSMC